MAAASTRRSNPIGSQPSAVMRDGDDETIVEVVGDTPEEKVATCAADA
jgi:hypothetical protein